MLYEMATGKKPFHGKNTVTTLSAVLRDKPKSPAELNPKLPAEFGGHHREGDAEKTGATAIRTRWRSKLIFLLAKAARSGRSV